MESCFGVFGWVYWVEVVGGYYVVVDCVDEFLWGVGVYGFSAGEGLFCDLFCHC